MMNARSGRAGFTIAELLVAAAVFGVILTLLGSVFVGTRRAYDASDAISETRQSLQSAVQLLSYDIGLAGYRGTDGSPATLNTDRPFADLPLQVIDGVAGASDTVRVRFYEDRFVAGAPVLRVVEYAVVDGDLVRIEDDAVDVVVEGVAGFQVISWLNRAASEFVTLRADTDVVRPAPADLAGIALQVTLANQTQPVIVVVALLNPQCTTLPC